MAVGAEEKKVTLTSLLNKTVDLETLYHAPDHRVTLFSSFDRSGGNQDGSGYLRKEGDWYVIAEMEGPGAVTRIWSANPKGMIRIYIDDGSEPLLQRSFRDLFLSNIKPFVKPFVRSSIRSNGAYWSYIPIPFGKFCKIAIDELCYYQIECAGFPPQTQVEPLTIPFPSALEKQIKTIGNRFRASVKPPFRTGKQIKEHKYRVKLTAGASIDLATFSGPGVIRGMRMTWPKNSKDAGRELMLRCYWDGEAFPSVQAPIRDFFSSGIQTIALGHEQKGWDYIYFPMPFLKSARIHLDNGAMRTTRQISLIVYVQERKDLPTPLRTFHAWWNRDNETPVPPIRIDTRTYEPLNEPKFNYTAFSSQESGHLAGLRMSMTPSPESDVAVFINRPLTPQVLRGTGKMGFFNMAWRTQTVNWPLSGGKSSQQGPDELLRLFLPAPIPYTQGARITVEHGSGNVLRKDYASMVYWYQEEPHDAYPWPPPPPCRQNRKVQLIQPVFEFQDDRFYPRFPWEAEILPVELSGGFYDTQDMRPHGPDWSGNRQIRFEAFHPGAEISLQLPIQSFSGWHWLEFTLTCEPKGGIADVQLNDRTVLGALDLYSTKTAPKKFRSIEPVFIHASDAPRVGFAINGKNPKSSGTVAGIDYLQLKPVETVPKALEVLGPYAILGDSEHSAIRTIQSVDGDRLLLGYSVPRTGKEEPGIIRTPQPAKGIDVGALLGDASMNEGYCFLSWTVQIGRPGIYCFELKPAEIEPILIREDSGRMMTLKNHLLLNGVLLSGNDTMRYDPVVGQMMPKRFHVPLQQGENRLSWLVKCDPKTIVQPVLYGVEKD